MSQLTLADRADASSGGAGRGLGIGYSSMPQVNNIIVATMADGRVLTVGGAQTTVAELERLYNYDKPVEAEEGPAAFLSVGKAGVGLGMGAVKFVGRRALTTGAKDLLRAEGRALWTSITGRKASLDLMQIHHRVPLEWAHLFPNANPNRIANLVGMQRAGHEAISKAWAAWKQALGGRIPSAAEVLEHAIRLDEQFGHLMKFVK